jgi:hypothetical protein
MNQAQRLNVVLAYLRAGSVGHKDSQHRRKTEFDSMLAQFINLCKIQSHSRCASQCQLYHFCPRQMCESHQIKSRKYDDYTNSSR